MARQSRTHGRKIFRPYIHGAAAHGGHAITTRGRLRINRIRRGEIFFARTSMVRRRGARARSQRAGDGASIAHAWAKNISPAHPWCGSAWRVRDRNVWAIAHHWRINRARRGEISFARTSMVRRRVAGAPPQCVGDCASTARARAKYISPVHPWCGGGWRVRNHNVWAIAHQRRTWGRKIFRPYIRGAAGCGGHAITTRGRLCINRIRRGEIFFARTHAAR